MFFQNSFPLKIYTKYTTNPIQEIELKCNSNKLSMMEEDFDYEYIISCYGYSTRSIYDLRNGKYFLQFRGYYEQSSNSQISYNPLVMSATATSLNGTDPYSIIKIQKYDLTYKIIKSIDELLNIEITFKGIYIKNKPENILLNDYSDYGVYFITNNKEKLNSKCILRTGENEEINLVCKIDSEKLGNFMEKVEGIYNSYIFIAKLDIDYVLKDNNNNIEILERFIIDIGGTILISRFDDGTTLKDLEIKVQEQIEWNEDNNISNDDNNEGNDEDNKNTNSNENENDGNDNNEDNNNSNNNKNNKTTTNRENNNSKRYLLNKLFISILLFLIIN